MLPENLPLVNAKTDRERAALETAYKTPEDNTRRILSILGECWPIKVTFDEPVTINTVRRNVIDDTFPNGEPKAWHYNYSKTAKTHVFYRLYGLLYYTLTKNGRHGYKFPDNTIVKWEIVLPKEKSDTFNSYEDFRKKFDSRFITEEQIIALYNMKSPQTGKPFAPSDFRRVSPAAKGTLHRFLNRFESVTSSNKEPYDERKMDDSVWYDISCKHYTSTHSGRDITISHTFGIPRVSYSSEFQNCGNGSYGLLVSKSLWLHTEDD